MTDDDTVLRRAQEWIRGDPDPKTRAELEALVDADDIDEVADRMDGVLEFGTAGLRGRVEAGSNRMNRAVVIRATRGLADHILATTDEDRGPVVVGYDARHFSRPFMEDAVAVLAAAGLRVVYADEPVPTPLVGFVAKEIGAVAGIVITASHNPPADNGYKVFAPNAVQIVPPADREIARAIELVGPANSVAMASEGLGHPLVEHVREELRDRYFGELVASVPGVVADRSLQIVYTPLHGVGGRFVVMALERFGHRNIRPVPEQFEPDGDFPTVAHPNPEEPGALDLAHALAEEVEADLILANDPDADRLAVSVPWDGGWRVLTGNQIGALLTDFLLEHRTAAQAIVVSTIVSSPMGAALAESHGARFVLTLTGFKWIWTAALDLQSAGKGDFVIGYEEALGYSVGTAVRDKDGISAALLFAELAAACKAEGRSVRSRLEDLYLRHGLWVSLPKSIAREGPAGELEIRRAMDLLAEDTPESLGGRAVTGVSDFRAGADLRPRYLGESSLVEFTLGGAGRALIRPSGTEPKLKIYVDLRDEVSGREQIPDRETQLLKEAAAVADDLARFVGLGP